jgi:hypothetical protein
MDDRHFRERADADFKAWDEAQKRKLSAQQSLMQEIDHLESSMRDQYYQSEGSAIDRQKEMALQSLGLVDAQTIREKQALEDQKFAIESFYAEKSLALQIQKLNSERNLELGKIDRDARAAGLSPDDTTVIEAKRDANQLYDSEVDAAQIESNRKVYDSLKHDAEGLFDQLVFHTKSWGAFSKDILKATLLTPAKEIFSSQVSAFFTKGLTGQNVSFGEVGNGQGWFGKLGSVFGRAGLGQPKFGDANHPLSKLNAPNHLGDLSLIGGAVPVVIMNAPQVGSAHADAARSGYGPIGAVLANSFSDIILKNSAAGAQIGQQSPTHGVGEATFIPQAYEGESGMGPIGSALGASFGDLILSGAKDAQLRGFAQSTFIPQAYNGVSPSGFQTMGDVAALGTPSGIFSASDNPFVLPTPPPYDAGLSGTQLADWTNPNLGPEAEMAAPRSSGGGLANLGMGGMLSGGGLKAFLGQNSLGTDLGNGTAIANTGGLGHLAAFGKSNAAAMIGAGLLMDGLSRKPGKASAIETPLGAGMIGFKLGGASGGLIGAGAGLFADGLKRGGWAGVGEDTAGGALIGMQLGGPVGAVIGAAVGFGAGMFRKMFETDRDHAKKLVKQVYGMDINNATADQIVQIAKQSYGKQIDVAVRSPEVRRSTEALRPSHWTEGCGR